MYNKKKYIRETIPFIRNSPLLAESPSTLSWIAEIPEFRKGLIIWEAYKGWEV